MRRGARSSTAILVDAAAAAGADVRFGTAVTGVARDRHGTRHRDHRPGP